MSLYIPPPDLTAVAIFSVSETWKDNIYRDFEDEIKYKDGKIHGNPRNQNEIDKINNQIEHYASELIGEFIEELKSIGVRSLPEYYTTPAALEVHKPLWVKYRRKFRDYVGSEFNN